MMAHLQSLKPADMDIAKAQPNLRRSDMRDVTSEDTTMTNRESRKDGDDGEAGAGECDVEMDEVSSTAPHSGMGTVDGQSTKRRRDSNLPDLTKRVPLPSIFPVSMLEASQGLISLEIEQRMRTHLYNRVHRVEYASSGGLQQNDNKFVEPPLEPPQLVSFALDESNVACSKLMCYALTILHLICSLFLNRSSRSEEEKRTLRSTSNLLVFIGTQLLFLTPAKEIVQRLEIKIH